MNVNFSSSKPIDYVKNAKETIKFTEKCDVDVDEKAKSGEVTPEFAEMIHQVNATMRAQAFAQLPKDLIDKLDKEN